jgi:hypothetical protein
VRVVTEHRPVDRHDLKILIRVTGGQFFVRFFRGKQVFHAGGKIFSAEFI